VVNADYESWRVIAQELDANEGREEWKAREESPYYNHLLIKALLKGALSRACACACVCALAIDVACLL
jgi:hypothetical protein